ncbi:MAG: S-layer homology domain-containing protein [Bacillota bacterium]
MKRMITGLLASVLMSCSMSSIGFAANFTDMADVPWPDAATYINRVADLGLVSGYSDGTYRPRNEVSYVETMQMIYMMAYAVNIAGDFGESDLAYYEGDMVIAGIPSWAYRAVAFGLQNKIISEEEMFQFMENGNNKPATREDVAKMVGAAFANITDIDTTAAEVNRFTDWWDFTKEVMPYVDVAVRLGIFSGDTDGAFRPKDFINRAEMAVVLDKCYTARTYGVDLEGVVTAVTNNDGAYHIDITYDNGTTETFYARADLVTVYSGDNGTLSALPYIGVNDKVKIVKLNGALSEIHILEGIDPMTRFDITGYITKMSGSTITVENENTGNTEEFSLSSATSIILDGVATTASTLSSELLLDENYYRHAYVALDVDTTYGSEKTATGKLILVQYVTVNAIQVDFVDVYTKRGRVTKLTDDYVTFTTLDGETSTQLQISDTTDTSIDGVVASMTSMMNLFERGTVYMEATVAQNNVLVGLDFSNTYSGMESDESSVVYTLDNITVKQLDLTSSASEYVCYFGDDNPLSNITFFWWEESTTTDPVGTWKNYDLDAICSIRNSVLDEDEDAKIYAKLAFNAGGKLTQVHIAETRNAWTYDTTSGNGEERKGLIVSYDGQNIRFENVSTDYELLTTYNTPISAENSSYITGVDPNDSSITVRNPLTISSAVTSSLAVFQRMLEGDDIEIYAEIIADSNKKVQKIDARLVEAIGYLRYFDLDDYVMQLEIINTGEILNLKLDRRIDINADIIDDEEMESTLYHGSLVYLIFDTEGEVSELHLWQDAYTTRDDYVSGEAIGNGNGFYIDGRESKTYGWGNRSSTFVKNYSINSDSTYTVQDMLDDSEIGVYVEANLTENSSIDRIAVYATSAIGVLDNYNKEGNTIRIKTDAGKTYAFYIERTATFNVKNIAADDLNQYAIGTGVSLTFSNGVVTRVDGI